MSDRWKEPCRFYWLWWAAVRTSFFPLRSRMGSQGTTKGTWTENASRAEKPYQVVTGIYDVPSDQHLFHWGPGWDPKTQHQWPKSKMSDRQKNLAKFLLNLMRLHQDIVFSSGAQDGIPRGNRTERTQKCVTSSKHLVKLLMEFMRFYQESTFSIRTQDGVPRNSYRNEAWKCLAGEQTLSGFIWFYEIPLEYRFFH